MRRDLYLLILRAISMFFMAAHGLYFILVPLMAVLLTYLEVWPERPIGAVFGDPSRLWEYDPGNPTSKPAPTRRSSAVPLFRGDYCGHCSPRFECFRPLSDLNSPIKLIKNQNASTIKADKLKAKMSETIISNAPAAFSSEYLGDELGSFSSCRSRYATMISTTPMNPARSDKWKLMVIATAVARRF